MKARSLVSQHQRTLLHPLHYRAASVRNDDGHYGERRGGREISFISSVEHCCKSIHLLDVPRTSILYHTPYTSTIHPIAYIGYTAFHLVDLIVAQYTLYIHVINTLQLIRYFLIIK